MERMLRYIIMLYVNIFYILYQHLYTFAYCSYLNEAIPMHEKSFTAVTFTLIRSNVLQKIYMHIKCMCARVCVCVCVRASFEILARIGVLCPNRSLPMHLSAVVRAKTAY